MSVFVGSLGHLPNQGSLSDLIAMESKITEISYLTDLSITFKYIFLIKKSVK